MERTTTHQSKGAAHTMPAILTAGQKAAETRRQRLALAASRGTSETLTAGQKAAATRIAHANGQPVRIDSLTYKVPSLDGASLVRKMEDGEIVWRLMVRGSFMGEVVDLGSDRWGAATRTQQLGDRFESRQAAVARLVASVKVAAKAGDEVKARKVGHQCPSGHGILLELKGSARLHCPSIRHMPAIRVGQAARNVGIFEMVDGQPVEMTTIESAK